jgi:hypothetical protein
MSAQNAASAARRRRDLVRAARWPARWRSWLAVRKRCARGLTGTLPEASSMVAATLARRSSRYR